MRSRLLSAAALSAALVLVPTAAVAGGSDSPVPYTVTAAGLTLPAGSVFDEYGDINYTVTALDGSARHTFGVHNEVPHNGKWPAGQYVGASSYAWTDHPDFARYFPGGYCVVWVQVSGYDEHFGEGGQAPVCTTDPTPTPTDPAVDPTPEPTPTPTEPGTGPTPDPTPAPTDPTVEPTPTPTPTEPTVDPTTPAPTPTPGPTTTPLTPADPGRPVDPSTPPTTPAGPGATHGGGGSSTDALPAAPSGTATDPADPATDPEAAALADDAEQLAHTGASVEGIAPLVAAVVAAGSGMLFWARRARPERAEG
jgi:hypothetical protein